MSGPVENMDKGQSVQRMEKGLRTMRENMTPDELFQELIVSIKRYHPSGDISMVEKAYRIAYDAHKDQKRKSCFCARQL